MKLQCIYFFVDIDADQRKVAPSSNPRKSEIMYRKMGTVIDEIVKKLCDPKKRQLYNEFCINNSKQVPLLKVFERNESVEDSLKRDLTILCELTLRNIDGKYQTLTLLKNLKSTIYFLFTKIVNGLFSRGTAILKPPSYTNCLRPLPQLGLLGSVFSIKVNKYADSMKCIQCILHKKSFVKHVLDTNFSKE